MYLNARGVQLKIHDLKRLVNVSFALVCHKLIGETCVCGRFARVVALNRVGTGTMDNVMQTEDVDTYRELRTPIETTGQRKGN